MSYQNFFGKSVIGEPDQPQTQTVIQGTSFINGKPVAGYVDGKFERSDRLGGLERIAREKMWEKMDFEKQVPAEPAVDLVDRRKGME